MKIEGNLSLMPLADLIQWIGNGRKTGRLSLKSEKDKKDLFFQSGNLIFSRSSIEKEHFGTYLVDHTDVTSEQVDEALKVQSESREMIGYIVVQKGWLTKDEVVELLEKKTSEDIYEVFLWEKGTFKFTRESPPQRNFITVDLDSMNLVMEGVRRMDEWKRIKAAFPSLDVILDRTDVSLTGLTEIQEKIYETIDAETTIRDIIDRIPGTKFETMSNLFEMYKQGGVDILKTAKEAEKQEITKLLSRLYTLQEQNRYVEALNFAREGLEQYSDDESIREIHEEISAKFRNYLDREYFSTGQTPVLDIDMKDLERLESNQNEAFILSRIAGADMEVNSLLDISPMDEIETLRILKRLTDSNIITFRER